MERGERIVVGRLVENCVTGSSVRLTGAVENYKSVSGKWMSKFY